MPTKLVFKPVHGNWLKLFEVVLGRDEPLHDLAYLLDHNVMRLRMIRCNGARVESSGLELVGEMRSDDQIFFLFFPM